MSNIKEIQDRIRSVSDTMKITNAMYMISSNKMRKARKMLAVSEPYFHAVEATLARILRHLPDGIPDVFVDPDLTDTDAFKEKGYLVITGDKGLAGAYNHNVIREAEARYNEDPEHSHIYVVGEPGSADSLKRGLPVVDEFRNTAQDPNLDRARRICNTMLDAYRIHKLENIQIIFSEMINSMTCEVRTKQLLPLNPREYMLTLTPEMKQASAEVVQEEFLMLPSAQQVIDHTVPQLLSGFVYGALVEAFCSEQNSRMMAMDHANKNAQEMIHDLGILYNRERQARITQEITEVVSGAKALKRTRERKEQLQKRGNLAKR